MPYRGSRQCVLSVVCLWSWLGRALRSPANFLPVPGIPPVTASVFPVPISSRIVVRGDMLADSSPIPGKCRCFCLVEHLRHTGQYRIRSGSHRFVFAAAHYGAGWKQNRLCGQLQEKMPAWTKLKNESRPLRDGFLRFLCKGYDYFPKIGQSPSACLPSSK